VACEQPEEERREAVGQSVGGHNHTDEFAAKAREYIALLQDEMANVIRTVRSSHNAPQTASLHLSLGDRGSRYFAEEPTLCWLLVGCV